MDSRPACHRTSIAGCRGILADGFIYPNDGRYPFTYSQSQKSYGFRQGYVCLFDFKIPTLYECFLSHETWAGILLDQEPVTVVVELRFQGLEQKLISEKEPDGNFFIPYVEAWYPEPIPISFMRSKTEHHGFTRG
jgi:hypothetical protein